tara:strand:+ start:841 stop:1089 length:249 start_codon:yes stop_codon:yes gene_type:complete
MLKFNIEKNIPMPKSQHGKKRYSKYGFHKLEFEVGDSVLFTDHKIAKTAHIYFNKYSERNNIGQKYSIRKVSDNEWRLWRVK